MSLRGLRVIGFESRRAELLENLVEQQGGECFNAPSVRELPLEENEECLQLVRDLAADRYDALILLTGVGAEYLRKAAATLGMEEDLVAAADRVKTVARGPKPAAVLRKWGVPADVTVPEPNTWREVVDAMIAWCHAGPPAARVDAVEVEWTDPDAAMRTFQIRR